MKSFKEFNFDKTSEKYEWCTISIDSEVIHILFEKETSIVLNEAKTRGTPVGGPYSVLFHKAHSTVGSDHIHGYEKNNQLFALNVDGTAHDQSHGVRIPNRLAKGIKNCFPNVTLPTNNMIENAPHAIQLIAKSLIFG